MADPTKPTRRAKASKQKARANAKTIQIAVPLSGTVEETKVMLSKSVPDWDELTKGQQAELAEIAVAQSNQRQPVKVTLTRKPEGGMSIGMEGKCEAHGLLKLQKTFAAVSMDPVNARANELLKYLGSVGADSAGRYNAALSFIESMEPRNQAEALLLVQMYVTHDAAIRALSQLGSLEYVPTIQMFGNLATKLLRTSQGQMETLAHLRRGGEQVVKHIHVDNRGGQAIVTDTVVTGGENGKSDGQSHAAGMLVECAALPRPDPQGFALPVTGLEGKETVPDARGHESRRSEGQQERMEARRPVG